MALNFPIDPASVDNTYVGDNGITYTYDGTKWTGHSISSGGGGTPAPTDRLANGSAELTFGTDGKLTFPDTLIIADSVISRRMETGMDAIGSKLTLTDNSIAMEAYADPDGANNIQYSRITVGQGGTTLKFSAADVGGETFGQLAVSTNLLFTFSDGVVASSFGVDNGGVVRLTNGSYLEPISSDLNIGAWGDVTIRSDAESNLTTKEWTFDKSGTISVPSMLPITFTAVLDSEHMIDAIGFASGDLWHFVVEFQVTPEGDVQTVITNETPWASNPGYVTGFEFAYTDADHGIPGYTFTLAITDIQHPGEFMWTANLAAGIAPSYPRSLTSEQTLALHGRNSVVITTSEGIHEEKFRFNGRRLYLPQSGDIVDYLGNSVLGGSNANIGNFIFDGLTVRTNEAYPTISNADGASSTAGGVEIDFNSDTVSHAMWLNGDDGLAIQLNRHLDQSPSDHNSTHWYFGPDGALTFPDGTKQTTAATSQSGGDPLSWVNVLDYPNDSGVSPAIVSSTEYDSDGNVIALVINYLDGNFDFTNVMKISPSGVVLAQKEYSNTLTIDGWGLAVDGDNNVYITGTMNGGQNDIFVIKLDSTLTEVWAKSYGDVAGTYEEGFVIDVPADGNPVLVGASAANNGDILVIKLSNIDGAIIWQKILGTLGQEQGWGMAVGPNSEVVVVGTLSGNPDTQLVVSLDSTGAVQWQKTLLLDENFYCDGADADIDPDGNIYVLGTYNWNGGSGLSVTKLDSTGTASWTRKVTGPCYSTAASIVFGDDGFLYLSSTTGQEINGGNDIKLNQVLAKYTTSGTVVWQRYFKHDTEWVINSSFLSGSGEGSGSNLAVKNGRFVLGTTRVTAYFQGNPLDANGIIFQASTEGSETVLGAFSLSPSNLSGLLTSPFLVNDAELNSSTSDLVATAYVGGSETGSITANTYHAGGTYTGTITFDGNTIMGDGSTDQAFTYGRISLIPNNNTSLINTGQFLNIYPTNGQDAPHIHIAAGTGGDLVLGPDFDSNVDINHDGTVRINASMSQWKFSGTGTTTFPTLSVDLHNGGAQSGQVLQFGDNTQQVIITGPTPLLDQNAQRIVIQGQRGSGQSAEGGDVYVWAGDAETNAGDIKIYAGDADSTTEGFGGYVNIAGGSGYSEGGQVYIRGGDGEVYGGGIRIHPGYGASQSGAVRIETVSNSAWVFGPDGNLSLPAGSAIREDAGAGSFQGGVTVTAGQFNSFASPGGPGATINGNNSFTNVSWQYVLFTDQTLYNAVTAQIGSVNGVFAINWGAGSTLSTGFVLVQFVSGDSFQMCPVVDADAGANTPVDGTWFFDANFGGTFVAGTAYTAITKNGFAWKFKETGATVLPGAIVNSSVIAGNYFNDPVYPQPIDLTKTINKLSDNNGSWYTLADGVEGQMLYLVRKHDVIDLSLSSIAIHVANAYYGVNQLTDQVLYFNGDIITLIFTDGAWQQSGGLWD